MKPSLVWPLLWGSPSVQGEAVTMQLAKYQNRGNYKHCVPQPHPHSGADVRRAEGRSNRGRMTHSAVGIWDKSCLEIPVWCSYPRQSGRPCSFNSLKLYWAPTLEWVPWRQSKDQNTLLPPLPSWSLCKGGRAWTQLSDCRLFCFVFSYLSF